MNLEEYALTEDQEKKASRFLESLVRTEPMPYMSCPFYERCEVQVCPMDPMKTERIWYSEEGPCINPEFSSEKMVKTQKKLTKKRAEGYFTFGMLNRDMIIRRGMQGIDPDVPMPVYNRGQKAIDSYYADKERQWLLDHPEITAEQRERMKQEGMKRYETLKRHIGGHER